MLKEIFATIQNNGPKVLYSRGFISSANQSKHGSDCSMQQDVFPANDN